jgi:hypothetical protein
LGIVVFIILIISFFFHSVEVKVTSKKDNITFLNDVYTGLYNKNNLNNQNEVKKISLGKIKITNNTKDLQTLREETRFQFGEGDKKIIYKILNRTSIKSKGSIVVDAYSDGFGEKYNQKKGDEKLVVPGFKEAKMTKEYENIFGQIEEDFSFSSEEVKKNNEDSIKTLGYTGYEIITIPYESKKEISSIGIEEVFKKATGKIKIINNTNKNQKLRKETRFQNGDLIFKTQKSVTIPSNSFVVAEAFADESGRIYNIGKDNKFVIPGFKEAKMMQEYEKITGVVYSDFVGGMIGKINIPNKDELEIAKSNLNKESLELLQGRINNHNKKKDYVFLDVSSAIENIFKTEVNGDKIIVSLESTKKIPVIKKSDFIAMILKSNEVASEKLNSIEIKDFSKLNFKIINDDNFDINSENDILFSINGNAEIS